MTVDNASVPLLFRLKKMSELTASTYSEDVRPVGVYEFIALVHSFLFHSIVRPESSGLFHC